MPLSHTNLAWDTLLEIDSSSHKGALHLRVTNALRTAIRTGHLPSGGALPPSRLLASQLGCSRWVVIQAYDQLVAEGYLEARVGSATRVRRLQHELRPAAGDLASDPETSRLDFGPGLPDLRAFPRAAWSKALRSVLVSTPYHELAYQPRGGHPRLRQVLANYLGRVRGADASPENVTITTGIVDGITQLARTMPAQNMQRIAVEDPGWDRIRRAVSSAGLQSVPITVDGEGMRTADLPAVDVSSVVVTPAHQFPTGVVLTPDRREELLDWARSADGLILEDDYDAEFRYDRRPLGSLQGIDSSRVALLGSVSKTLAPALGLGWIITPPRWTAALRAADERITGPAVVDQLALVDFIESGAYDRHLRKLRLCYRKRRDRVVSELTKRLPKCRVSGAAAGMHVLLMMPQGLIADSVRAMLEKTVRVMDLRECRMNVTDGDSSSSSRSFAGEGIVLGYGNLADRDVDKAVDALVGAIGPS